MEKVVELIEKTMKTNSLSNADLAKTLGVSPSAVSKLLNNLTEISFTSFLSFAQTYCSDILTEVLITYCDSIEKNKENLRLCLEYSSIHADYELFEYLLEKESNSSYDINREWAEVYQLVYNRQKQIVSANEVISLARNYKCKTFEMKVLCQILEVTGYYQKEHHRTMFEISSGLEESINKIKNRYIRSMFLSRLSILYANGYLRYKNDVEQSRKYSNYIINNEHLGIRYKASAYHTLALTYAFSDYEKAIAYLEQSYQIYTDINDEFGANGIITNIEFLNNIWEKNDIPVKYNFNEKIHREIKIGNLSKANIMLNNITKETPFTKYYKALTIKDDNASRESLYEALEMFVNRGDRFYAENLVAKELLKRNERPIVLRIACTI